MLDHVPVRACAWTPGRREPPHQGVRGCGRAPGCGCGPLRDARCSPGDRGYRGTGCRRGTPEGRAPMTGRHRGAGRKSRPRWGPVVRGPTPLPEPLVVVRAAGRTSVRSVLHSLPAPEVEGQGCRSLPPERARRVGPGPTRRDRSRPGGPWSRPRRGCGTLPAPLVRRKVPGAPAWSRPQDARERPPERGARCHPRRSRVRRHRVYGRPLRMACGGCLHRHGSTLPPVWPRQRVPGRMRRPVRPRGAPDGLRRPLLGRRTSNASATETRRMAV